jgi:hypothetical protein
MTPTFLGPRDWQNWRIIGEFACRNCNTNRARPPSFGHSDFGFDSGIRASDFGFPPRGFVPARRDRNSDFRRGPPLHHLVPREIRLQQRNRSVGPVHWRDRAQKTNRRGRRVRRGIGEDGRKVLGLSALSAASALSAVVFISAEQNQTRMAYVENPPWRNRMKAQVAQHLVIWSLGIDSDFGFRIST